MWRPSTHRPAEEPSGGASRRRQAPAKHPGRPRDTDAEERIIKSAMELLGVLGYNGMSIEAVAAHAGVGKTTVYRRWACKGRLVVDAMARFICAPQWKLRPRGDLRRDLRDFVGAVAGMMDTGVARNIMAGLAADMAVKPEVAAAYQELCVGPKREELQSILDHAAARGEVHEATHTGLAADMLLGAIVWRSMYSDAALDEAFCDDLADRVAASLRARTAPVPAPRAASPPASG